MIYSYSPLLVSFAIVAFIGGQIAVSAQTEGKPQTSKLKVTDAQHILSGHCELLQRTVEFPDRLKTAFTKITGQDKFSLANPGEDFQVGDVIYRKLPSRRLVMAGKCEGFWFIHYEQGGIGHSYGLVLFQDEPNGETSFVWGGRGFVKCDTVEKLRKAIAGGLLSDLRQYYW
ncbi:MAG TPA: hypothetical protein VGF01_02960 [Terracidiphilus sp.]